MIQRNIVDDSVPEGAPLVDWDAEEDLPFEEAGHRLAVSDWAAYLRLGTRDYLCGVVADPSSVHWDNFQEGPDWDWDRVRNCWYREGSCLGAESDPAEVEECPDSDNRS